jgi:hypothetical protein
MVYKALLHFERTVFFFDPGTFGLCKAGVCASTFIFLRESFDFPTFVRMNLKI